MRVPQTQPAGSLQVRVEFDTGPLAGRVQGAATVQVVSGVKKE